MTLNTATLGRLAGYAVLLLVASFCGYAATYFVTLLPEPATWTPAGRLVFLGTTVFVFSDLRSL